ncbi:MAG: SDR family NAD(P)-dependent oxidoreductase [Planctomycetaceae bacterium]
MFSRIAENYRGSNVVIIGAGGIGRAILDQVASLAANVLIADYSETALQDLASQKGSAKIHTQVLNVREAEAVSRFFRELPPSFGTPHFVFYTAGVLNIETFADTSPEIWNKAVEINLNGAFYTAQAAAELMKPERRGSILILSSIAGTKARSGSRVNPVYNATKAALVAFVNAAAMQLRSHGIRINSISPGPTATAMMNIQPPQVHAAVSEVTLDNRMNNPSEVAELATFIAAHGRFTGEDLGMGGGAGLGG